MIVKYLNYTLITVMAVLLLSGCASTRAKYHVFHDNSKHYKKSKTTQPLAIPKGYSSTKFQQYYIVPNPSLSDNLKPVSLLPPDLNTKTIPAKAHWWS